jgi:hypothetical protein
MPLTQTKFLRLMKRHNPARPEDFKPLRIKIKAYEQGAFRAVYRVVGLPLVIKFPKPGTDFAVNKIHTRTELARIKKFRRFRWMHKYLPKVYYSNPKTGVSVVAFIDDSKPVTIHGDLSNYHQQRMHGMCSMAQELIFRLTGTKMTDITDYNVRYDQKRRVSKLIDLAY